jgi:hypothetical protein
VRTEKKASFSTGNQLEHAQGSPGILRRKHKRPFSASFCTTPSCTMDGDGDKLPVCFQIPELKKNQGVTQVDPFSITISLFELLVFSSVESNGDHKHSSSQ